MEPRNSNTSSLPGNACLLGRSNATEEQKIKDTREIRYKLAVKYRKCRVRERDRKEGAEGEPRGQEIVEGN
jgi:hypothetical protein